MLTMDKLKHNLEVARLCYTIAKEKYNCCETYARALWTIGYNHDIGYEFLEKSKDNPKLRPDISDELILKET